MVWLTRLWSRLERRRNGERPALARIQELRWELEDILGERDVIEGTCWEEAPALTARPPLLALAPPLRMGRGNPLASKRPRDGVGSTARDKACRWRAVG